MKQCGLGKSLDPNVQKGMLLLLEASKYLNRDPIEIQCGSETRAKTVKLFECR